MSISFTGLTPIQLNVIQVAIDHMEEHLADVASGISEHSVEDLESKVETLERLIAAKQLKAELKWTMYGGES
tara:strand:+ start:471 stop:686 length:216 start_codon:yes stop_codon:yes gene_type:complete